MKKVTSIVMYKQKLFSEEKVEGYDKAETHLAGMFYQEWHSRVPHSS